MRATSGRTCLILALLTASLAAAISVGTRSDAITVQAHVASMQLQGAPEADDGLAVPDVDDGHKTVACTQRDCAQPGVERAPVLAENPQPNEGKAFAAIGDVVPKGKD